MNVKILAVAVVAIVAVAAVGIYFVTIDDGEDGPIQIVDGSGATITLDQPLTGLVTVNTNAPKAMKMIGLEEELKGLCFYTSSDTTDQSSWNMYKDMFPNAVHMSRISASSVLMSGEEIIDKAGVKYVLCPVNSMTVSATSQVAFENLGITVIRLDFNGDTALEDLDKLATLFGKTEKVMNALNGYLGVYNSVVNTVKAKAAELNNSDKTFLFLMSAADGGSFYNQTAAASNIAESIYGKNALRDLGSLDLTKISNSATQDGMKEAIVDLNDSNKIDKIFIRGTTSVGPGTIWGNKNCALSGTGYENLIGSESYGVIYTFQSELMSGPLAYIGYVLIAEACGIDTGYNVTDLIQEYNNTYGFDTKTTGYMCEIVISGGIANATEVVII